MALRSTNQAERNRSQIFSEEPEPCKFSSKKVGFAVKDEIGEALKQPQVADDVQPRKKGGVIVRPPPTPEIKHKSRKQYIPTPGKKERGKEVSDKSLSESYVSSNQRLFQTQATPFATSTTPDVGRFKRMTISSTAADHENQAPAGSGAQAKRGGTTTMGSLLQWDD